MARSSFIVSCLSNEDEGEDEELDLELFERVRSSLSLALEWAPSKQKRRDQDAAAAGEPSQLFADPFRCYHSQRTADLVGDSTGFLVRARSLVGEP